MKNRRLLGVGAAGDAVAHALGSPNLRGAPTAAAPQRRAEPATLGAQSAGTPTPVGLDVLDRPTTTAAPTTSTTSTTAPAPPPPAVPQCPVGGPVQFIDSWGFARSGGRRHQGVDMLAATGTPVVAPVDGVVGHRTNRTGGLSYHLVAGDGTYYYGTHLSAYGASGLVAAGTVIGYVGDSGNARGTPHLHFEIHPGGEGTAAVNPYPMAAAWCGVKSLV